MANNEGPRIPPPPTVRSPGQFPNGQRIPPPPPPGFRPPGSGGAHGPGPMQMQMPMAPKIIQQSSRIRDITPQKLLTEADCLQKLTTYGAFSIRKVPAISPREKPSWARAEVTEDRLDQVDIKKQIKKLGERGKTVAEKRAALAQFQQGQVTALLDELASTEQDENFEWSLVQMDRIEREVPSSKPGKKAIETVVMILYVKRAPLPGLNAVMLFQNIEKKRIDSLRPPPPPPPQQQQRQQQQPPPPPPPPPHHEQRPPTPHGKMGGGQPFVNLNGQQQNKPKPKQRDNKYHDRDDSRSSNSSDSYDTASGSESDGSSSFGTSISSRSDQRHRRRNSKTPTRSHSSRHGPRYPLGDRILSPERPRPSDAYGVPHHPQHPQQHPQQPPQQLHQGPPPQRPYVPDAPRTIPAMDPITSAYQAGMDDARAEFGERIQSPVSPQPVIIERIIERPVERPAIERVIERPPFDRIIESPRTVVSYSRLPERPRLAERYHEDRYADDVRSQEDDFFIRRREAEDNAIMREERMRREAEEYIDGRPLERLDFRDRRQSFSLRGDSSPELSPTRDYIGRGQSESRDRDFRRPEPRRFLSTPIQPHPFAQVLPRRYPPSTSSRTYSDAGW